MPARRVISYRPALCAYDGDTGHLRRAAQGVGKRQLHILELALRRLCFPLKLLVALIYHPQAAGADGVAEGLETAVGLDGQFPLQGKGASIDVLLSIVEYLGKLTLEVGTRDGNTKASLELELATAGE